jgi:transposase
MVLTYRYRLKDGNQRDHLKKLAGQVNLVWNVSNEVIRENWRRSRKYTTKADLNVITRGSSKEMLLNSQTIQAVSYEVLLRTQKAQKRIRFRTGRKNLGWVPFNGQTVKYCGDYITYNGFKFRFWKHRKLLPGAEIKTGSFAEDSRGRWYLNLTIEVADDAGLLPLAPNLDVGIDPGTKTVLTTSDGEKFERENLTRNYEEKLAKAQRHRKKRQAKSIHAKIKNKRQDWNHKASHSLAKRYNTIYFGDADSSKLAQTRMAKGVLDACWYQIFTFLQYKSLRRGGIVLKVSEKFSTVTCSSCLTRCGPSGLSGLSIREWTCKTCGAVHDRDINSAIFILRSGRGTLREEAVSFSPKGSADYSAISV